jgi:hypothetical protein
MAIANSRAGADAGISSSISIGIPGRSLDSPAVVLGESTAHRGASTTTNAERGTVQFPQFFGFVFSSFFFFFVCLSLVPTAAAFVACLEQTVWRSNLRTTRGRKQRR